MASISERIREGMQLRDMKQSDIIEKTGINKGALSSYLAGRYAPKQNNIYLIARALDVSEAWLMGHDVSMERSRTAKIEHSNHSPKGIRINVYGSVPAGIPIEAIEDVVDWEDVPSEWTNGGQEYIGLRVKGDSMSPKYLDGDTVIIRIQPECESGQDCVVYVNGYDSTLKKVVMRKDGIMLQPLNPLYDPEFYDYNDALNPVTIVGVVVEIRRKV